MRSFRLFFCAILVATFLGGAVADAGEKPNIQTWLCYYGSVFGPDIYSRFDLVVLDGHKHPPIKHTRKGHPILLGYISIGEADEKGPLWELARGQPYLVKRNAFWESWIVDVRDPAWQRLLFEVAIPAVLQQDFDGLFLDTPDSSLSLLHGKDREKFEGVEEALKEIVKGIRERYPEKYIAINRGLPVLPRIAPYLDFVVVEDLYSYHAGHKEGYVRVSPETRSVLLNQVKAGLRVNPELTVLTLDYAGNGQIALAKEAIAFSRERGFIPYVSTYELDQVFYYTLGR